MKPPVPHTRVLLVVAQLTTGGAEVQLIRLARHLGSRGVHAEVAIYHRGGELEAQLHEAGIRVHHLKRFTRLGVETILDLRRVLRVGDYDVVHSFLWPANWRARLAGLLAGTPVIVSSPRSVETWLRARHVLVDRLLALWTDAIVVNAAAVRDFLISREGLPPSLFRLIYNGLDEAAFTGFPEPAAARRAIGLPADAPVAVIVGNFQPEKNHEDFLRMAFEVRRRVRGARFVMVGDGERRPVLERLAAELGLGDSLHWAGLQPDVRPYLAAADVCLNVSLREGCCNAILEAMAAGRPVVAYAVGGNPELVQHGVSGRLVDCGDTAGLAAAVADYLEDSQAAARDGAAGLRRARNGFSARVTVDQTVALYGELLRRRGVRP